MSDLAMKVKISEVDLEILYLTARGSSYKQIASELAMKLQTVKNRMGNIVKVFGAASVPNLIAMLIASDVLRVPDLYADIDVEIFEHRARGGYRRQSYRLTDVKP